MYWLDDNDSDRKGRESFALDYAQLVMGYFVQPSRAPAAAHDALDTLDDIYPGVAHVVANTCHCYGLLQEYRYKQATPFHLIAKPLVIGLVLAVLTQHEVWQHCGRWISAATLEQWFCLAVAKPLQRAFHHGWTFAVEYIASRAAMPRSMSAAQREQCLAALVHTTPRTLHERCLFIANKEFARAVGRSTLYGHFQRCFRSLCHEVYTRPRHTAACGALYDEAAERVVALVQHVFVALAHATLDGNTREALCSMTAQDVVGTCIFVAMKERCEAYFAREPVTRRSLVLSARLLGELHCRTLGYFHHVAACSPARIAAALDAIVVLTEGATTGAHTAGNMMDEPHSAETRRYSSGVVPHSETRIDFAPHIEYEATARSASDEVHLAGCDFACLRDVDVVACYRQYIEDDEAKDTAPHGGENGTRGEASGSDVAATARITLSRGENEDDDNALVRSYLASDEERAKRRVVMQTLYSV